MDNKRVMDNTILNVHFVSESSVLIVFGNTIDIKLPSVISQVTQYLKSQFGSAILDVTPSYTTLLVECHYTFDMKKIEDAISKYLISENEQACPQAAVSLPVFYDKSSKTDLLETAKQLAISPEELIRIHSNCTYTVCAIGFLPGFGFMAELPSSIVIPRRQSPKTVLAGSVAIADKQTAIYPCDSPGGWHVLGFCPSRLFNAHTPHKSLLAVGTTVKFEPISRSRFEALVEKSC